MCHFGIFESMNLFKNNIPILIYILLLSHLIKRHGYHVLQLKQVFFQWDQTALAIESWRAHVRSKNSKVGKISISNILNLFPSAVLFNIPDILSAVGHVYDSSSSLSLAAS